MPKPYEKEEIESAVKNSRSYADIFRCLGVKINGGSYPWIKNLIKKFEISTDHFWTEEERKCFHVKNLKSAKRRRDPFAPLQNGQRLKRDMLDAHLKRNNIPCECSVCNLSDWQGKLIVLDVDHIDSDCHNNAIENLQYICPNCHRQKTTEERRLNSKKKNIPYKERKKTKNCLCGAVILEASDNCISCYRKESRKVDWPTKEELEKLIWEMPTSKLAESYGVSDSAIGKWCKKYGIEKPPRGYWQKLKALDKN